MGRKKSVLALVLTRLARSGEFQAPALGHGPGLASYTIRLNHPHKLIGHLLSGRYKAHLVEGSGNGYCAAASEHRPHWIGVDRLPGEHGLQQDTLAARQEFECHPESTA
jgi:hypothetical protein